MIGAQVTLRRFGDRSMLCIVTNEVAVLVSDFDHPNRVVKAIVCAGTASDTRLVIDYDLPALGLTMDRTGRTLDHTHRIFAVHASAGDHHVVVDRSLTQEPRIVVMRRGASPHTIVAARAALDTSSIGKSLQSLIKLIENLLRCPTGWHEEL